MSSWNQREPLGIRVGEQHRELRHVFPPFRRYHGSSLLAYFHGNPVDVRDPRCIIGLQFSSARRSVSSMRVPARISSRTMNSPCFIGRD